MSIKIIGTCDHYIPTLYSSRRVSRPVGECVCGRRVELREFTNTCGQCGRDYSMTGQQLAPRSQWGEDTGESVSDILDIGHHIS